MQKPVVQFVESPRSPYRRARRQRSISPVPQSAVTSRKDDCVGTISEVNEHMGREGLLRCPPIQPLISEEVLKPITPEAVRKLRESKIEQMVAEDTMLIELATYPGYHQEKSTLLPHKLNTLEHMERITRAQVTFKTKPRFVRYWEQLFYSLTSQSIFLDVFWWYFLNHYQPNQTIQNQLFIRTAENYAELLKNAPANRYRDAFFQIYPDILVQTVYSAYTHAFPTSWSSFDETFKNEIYDLVFLWFLGYKPLPNSWKEWNIAALEPNNVIKHISMSIENDKSKKEFNLDALVAKATNDASKLSGKKKGGTETTSKKEEQQPPKKIRSKQTLSDDQDTPPQPITSPRIAGPTFEHSVLEVTSCTPLVQYHLHRKGLTYHRGWSRLLQHTSIDQQPDNGQLTLETFLKKSEQYSHYTDSKFNRYYSNLRKYMKQNERDRKAATDEHNRKMGILLAQPHEVKHLSSFITHNLLGMQSDKTQKSNIRTGIMESLRRIN